MGPSSLSSLLPLTSKCALSSAMNNDVSALLLLIALGVEKDHAIGMAQHTATNVAVEIFIFFSQQSFGEREFMDWLMGDFEV